jgi:hypothetical protein
MLNRNIIAMMSISKRQQNLGYKQPYLPLCFALLPILFLMLDTPNVMSYTYEYDGDLLYLGSDIFSEISRNIEDNCEDGIDNDNDGLIDYDDKDDCVMPP